MSLHALVLCTATCLGIAMPVSAQTTAAMPTPTHAMGTLAIQATQGTSGGPSAQGDAIEVHLFQDNQVAVRLDGNLDDNNMAMFTNVPLDQPLRPIVRIMHAGVTYQETGPLLSASKPNASMNVLIYETRLDQPQWDIVSRRVIVTQAEHELVIAELLIVENHADYTWLGGTLDDRDQRTSVTVSLPRNAHTVTLDAGFHGWCCTKYKDALLEVQMPLMPGRATFRYSYRLPVANGTAEVLVSGPVPTNTLSVFIPDTGLVMHPTDIVPAGMQVGDAGPMRVFQRESQPAFSRSGVVVAGLISEMPLMTPAHDQNLTSRILGSVALAVGIGVVLYVLFARKPKMKRT